MELVNKDSPLPCYYQVYRHLKGNIENHMYTDGQQLPSERTLSEQYNVNRFTIRRAIENLIGDGLVFPIRRKGYYIKAKDIDISIHKKTSYTQNMREHNIAPRVKILEMSTQDPTEELRELFGMDKGNKVWSIYFLRFYDNIPFALSRCHLPYDRMPELNIYFSEDTSLYSILNKKYGIIPTRVSSVCGACQSDKIETKHLSLLSASPLLKVTSTAVDQHGKFIEQSITKFRSDMVRIVIDLQNI